MNKISTIDVCVCVCVCVIPQPNLLMISGGHHSRKMTVGQSHQILTLVFTLLVDYLSLTQGGGEINWETGIDIYTVVYTKQTTNKDLLYSTGNSIQYSVMAYMGKESKKKKKRIYVCV